MADRLQQQAKEMEEELRMWEDEVQKARKEYYELNYYTTMQLLTLRKELGKLKTSGQPHVNPHVLALLQSISTEISPPCVCKVVKGVAIEEQKETGGIINRPKWPSLSVPGVACLGLACVGLAWLAWLGVVSLGTAWFGMVWFGFSLANDILASARTSCNSLQQPMLSYDQLSVKQKEIFDNLMNRGYSKQLILRALERFVDQHEAENWITENTNQHGSSDDESERSDIDEEEEAGSDSETESETDVVPEATPLPNPIGMNLFLCGATVVCLLSAFMYPHFLSYTVQSPIHFLWNLPLQRPMTIPRLKPMSPRNNLLMSFTLQFRSWLRQGTVWNKALMQWNTMTDWREPWITCSNLQEEGGSFRHQHLFKSTTIRKKGEKRHW